MKILYITPFVLRNNANQAGVNCSYNLIKLIKEQYNASIDIIGTINSHEINTDYKDIKIYTDNQYFYNINRNIKLKNILVNMNKPVLATVRYDVRVKNKIKELVKLNNYDYILVDYTQNSLYINDIKKCNYNGKIILIEQDVSFLGYKRKYDNAKSKLSRLMYKFEYNRLKTFETNIAKRFDVVLTLNEKDAKLLDSNNIKIIKPFVKDWNVKQREHTGFNIMFWGAMNRKENEEAVYNFVNNIWPLVHRENTKFYIIGANPSEKIKRLACESVVVTGFVDSPKEYFEIMDLSVVPLTLGAGIKIKVLESLANGIPVVTTSIGAEGIETSSQMFVTNDWNEFARKVNFFKKNNSLEAHKNINDIDNMKNNYSFSSNVKVLDGIFRK
ncbi:MAG: glycosyltransferase [Clostridium perfringens]|nr:glycosyltransferase [Clostridium perfringens]